MLARRMPWTSQPPAGTPIDWTNPLFRGLDVLHRSPWDPNLASLNADLIVVGTPTRDVSAAGHGAGFGGSYTNRFTCDWPAIPNGQQYTYAYIVTMKGISTTDLAICADNVDSATRSMQMQIVAGAPNLIVFNTAGTTFSAGGAGSIAVGVPSLIIGRASTKSEIWVNGKLGTTAPTITGTIQGAPRTPVNATQLGCRSYSGGNSLNGTLHLIARWQRALTNLEIAAFFANPWQGFLP